MPKTVIEAPIDLMRDRRDAEVALKAAKEELDKLAYDYNQLADTLCRTDDLLAETEEQLDKSLALTTRAIGQRDEARAIAGELFAFARAIPSLPPPPWEPRALAVWNHIRPGVRKALER